MTHASRIGIFDSGVGGLSVLRALRLALPHAALHYVADSAHAPYGERPDAHVQTRSMHIAELLVQGGARMLVVACNTATAVAVDALRTRWPGMPIVGVEPGIKPALALTRNGRIGVMATRATLASGRFSALLAHHTEASEVHVFGQACDGLAAAIESGEIDSAEVIALIDRHSQPLRQQGVDTVVLGCTHYPLASLGIQKAFGDAVRLIDTSAAVARQAAARWQTLTPASSSDATPTELLLQTTGDVATLERIASRWLDVGERMLHVERLR